MSDKSMRRLSYADPKAVILVLTSLSVSLLAAAYVGLEAYSNASFFDEELPRYVSDEIYYVDVARRLLENVFGAEIEFYPYSGKTDDNYYNAEHPPLGKYIIALSMLLCGDEPLCWRLPSVIEASLIPLVLWIGFAAAFRRPAGYLAATAASVAAASDSVLVTMGSVAMLDIHQAFFTAVAIALALNKRFWLASIASGLAASVKMSGGAVVIATAVLASLPASSHKERLLRFVASMILAGTVYISLYIPLMAYFGVQWVLDETIDALRWHTSSRPEGPPTSTLLGWVINSNPFYLSLSGKVLAAVTNTLLHAYGVAFGLTAFLLEAVRKSYGWPGVSHVFMFFIVLLYAMVYLAGNQTQYSFYSVQLTPIAAALVGETVLFMIGWRWCARESGDSSSSSE
ncbi:MAG: glycosyltransferase family 39 protein [Aeropyrum sp.]|nr:glycosyltransferase family 39 protein [Aeropyrum sp.]